MGCQLHRSVQSTQGDSAAQIIRFNNATTVQTDGVVTLNANNGVQQNAASRIIGASNPAAAGLRLLGGNGFDLVSPGNNVATLAANLTGTNSALNFRNSGAISVGSVLGTNGITIGTGAATNTLSVVAGGTITQTQAITAGPASFDASTAAATTLRRMKPNRTISAISHKPRPIETPNRVTTAFRPASGGIAM